MEGPRDPSAYHDNGYALSGKIMLSAIVILFFVVILMVCLHLYARWYLLRARRRHVRRNRHRRTHLVFYVDSPNPVSTASRGLDAAVLQSLPVFVYSSKTHQDGLDCAVCLSEFEEGESGRVLPKCNHSFHIGCIDMWFQSHPTCPLCRSPVEPGRVESEEVGHVVVSVSEPGSSSGMCDTCRQEEGLVETTSSGDRRKREFVGVSIEVPRRNHNDGFDSETTGCDSASSQTQTPPSFRSPVSRMLSLKRILSRERRGNVPSSPSSGIVESCSVAEPDLERGRDEIQQTP